MEFLGDAALGFLIADLLFSRFPAADEGQLTRTRAKLVKKETLAAIARELDLGEWVQLGEGELKSGGWRRDSILANTLEAVLGAVLLDGGETACRAVVTQLYSSRLDQVDPVAVPKDPKTELQEYLQSRKLPLPDYQMITVEGPAHAQIFTVECRCEAADSGATATGSSRRKAEQAAAQAMLALLSASGSESS